MDQEVANIKSFFSKAKRQAKAKIKPFVVEMENISIKRAKNVINDNQATQKMRSCCMKYGVNPQVIDGSYFEAQSIKMSSVGNNPIDFNKHKKGRQAMPEIKFKPVGIDFNGKKPNRQKSPKLDLPKMEFKPVDLFKPQPKKQNKNVFAFPNFNIKMPAQKHKKHQGRFEAVDLMPGPKGSNEIFIKPIFPGQKNKPKHNGPKAKHKKKPRIGMNNIKMPNFKGLI